MELDKKSKLQLCFTILYNCKCNYIYLIFIYKCINRFYCRKKYKNIDSRTLGTLKMNEFILSAYKEKDTERYNRYIQNSPYEECKNENEICYTFHYA